MLQALGLVDSGKKSFKVFISKIYFSLCDLHMRRTITIDKLFKKVM